MAIECEWKSNNCETLIRIFNFISGLYLIALGVLRFIFNSQISGFQAFLLSIYYILFGIIVILTEFNLTFIKFYFSFQEGFKGRGLFLIFIGVLCFDSLNLKNLIGILNMTAGVICCICGTTCFMYGCYSNKSQTNTNDYKNPVGQNSQRDASRI